MAQKEWVNVGGIEYPVWKCSLVAGDTTRFIAPGVYIGEMLVGGFGTWNGATITFTGKFDADAAEIGLVDLADAAISLTADPTTAIAVKHVWPNMRAVITGGDGSTALDVYMAAARIR